MVLKIVKYGHPVLRQKGVRIAQINLEVRRLITDMLDTMSEAHGVGLAAQQVGHALQLAVVDVTGIKDRPSTLQIHAEPVDVESFMPMVLINPEVKPVGEPVSGAEGCLSFPEIFGDITRPGTVDVTALAPDGRKLSFRCSGLLARAIQHEVDHLNGILFIDRMEPAKKRELKPELDDLQAETKAELKRMAG